jgi:hypothetical protein
MPFDRVFDAGSVMHNIMSGLICSTHNEQAKYVLVVTAAGPLRKTIFSMNDAILTAY